MRVLHRERWLMIIKNKHTISILQAQVRDLTKHIEAQPKKHYAYKKKKTCGPQFLRNLILRISLKFALINSATFNSRVHLLH